VLTLAPLKVLLPLDQCVDLALYDLLHGMAKPPAGERSNADRGAGAASHSLYDALPHRLLSRRCRRVALADLAAGLDAVQQGAQGAEHARYSDD
jgi:hypothetical protein